MKVAVIQFPGSNCDWDAYYACSRSLGLNTKMVWHKETDFGDAKAVIIPGGFSFGDYLRCGAIARFSPIVDALTPFAKNGGIVIGICNGFQILCEAGLLPGALIRNNCLEFRCMTVDLVVENSTSEFNQNKLGVNLRLPIAHGEGNYRIDAEGMTEIEANNQVLFRYSAPSGNPNGAMGNIAGIRNRQGNVFGMMPHPERAVEKFHPSRDGIKVLKSVLTSNLIHA